MPGGKISGVALVGTAFGALLVFAGLTGRDIPSAIKDVISGKSPATAPQKYGITGSGIAVGGSASSGRAAGDVSAGASEQSFFTAFLRDLGAPVTQANLQAMYRWALKEEPDWPPQNSDPGVLGLWNPLNIGGLGHLASYPTPQAGAFGTAGFLLANNYGAIVASLRTGNGIVDSPAVAEELLAFSGGGYNSVNHGGG